MKIKSLKIENSEKLGNIELDFSKDNIAQDTIIIAGNNGCGKTTILEEILLLIENGRATHLDRNDEKVIAKIILSEDELADIAKNIKESNIHESEIIQKLSKEMDFMIDFSEMKGTYNRLKFYNDKGESLDSYQILYHGKLEKNILSFYSSANIDYNMQNINNITNIDIDKTNVNFIRTSNSTGMQIKQTFIDIYNLDAQDFQEWAKRNIDSKIDKNEIDKRLRRFKEAFKYIMNDLEFDKIVNSIDGKDVIFKRKDKSIKIDDLSTGEKQIVIRGGYLLRFLNILQGSIILIDEPELSLHPEWQKKILQFYKKLFTDENGKQNAQIFVATHSPFVINNASRYNDKVIVLSRNDTNGNIEVVNNPTYYDCSNDTYIRDAFNINDFDVRDNILFTEGETDVRYLNKAIEIFYNNKVNFRVEWIGKKLENGKIQNTGCTGLSNLLKVLEANNNLFTKKVGLLYDCDTNKIQIKEKNYFTYTLKKYDGKVYKKGIENVLNLPSDFKYDNYYHTIEKIDEYGAKSNISEIDKVKLCDEICGSQNVENYLSELKNIIDEISKLMD